MPGPQLVRNFLNLAEFGAAHTGVPVDAEFLPAQPEWQRDRAQYGDSGAFCGRVFGGDRLPVAINLEQFSLGLEALADGRIDVGEHSARLCGKCDTVG